MPDETEKKAQEVQRDTDPLEEAQKVEQESDELGGDSTEGGGETKRPEQDRDAPKVPEKSVPSPSVR